MPWKESTDEERKEKAARLSKQGARLRELRKSKGLTKKELADMLHVSEGLIKTIESGRRSITPEKLEKCVEIFRCRAEYLTGETDYRDKAAELAAALPAEDRLAIAGREAVWRATEQWVMSCFPGEDLKEMERDGRIDLFELFCRVTEPIQESIQFARQPSAVRDSIKRGTLSINEIEAALKDR